MKIGYYTFSLMRPGVPGHHLSAGEAQVAYNCNVQRGDLRSFKAPKEIAVTSEANPKTLYQYSENGNDHWVVSDKLVHTVKSPVANEQYERLWFTGETTMRFHANDNISVGGFDPAIDFYKAGIPKPASTPSISSTGGGSEYRQYFYIFVNRYFDPGPRTDISNAITDYSSGRVTIGNIEDPAPTGRAIDRIWLYRINATKNNTAEYQFVLEAKYFDESTAYSVGEFVVYSGSLYECTTAHSAGTWNGSNFTLGEQVSNSDLGATFEYEDYTAPPDNLKGLCLHSSGAGVAYVGNSLYMSVPNSLHAWPIEYRKSLPYLIRGIEIIGNSIYVVGDGPPVRYYGQHPDSMAPYKYNEFLPCPAGAEQAISTWKGEVYYRTIGGMAKINEVSAVLFTTEQPGLKQIIDPETWESDFLPLHGEFYNDLYFGHGATCSFYIDFKRRVCCWITTYALASTISSIDGNMYMVIDYSGSKKIVQWNGDKDNYLQYIWRGRLEMLDYETNMAYALLVVDPEFYDQVANGIDVETVNNSIISAGPLEGDLRGGNLLRGDILLRGDNLLRIGNYLISEIVGLKVFGDEIVRDNRSINAKRMLTSLSPGWLASRFSVELSGYIPVLRAAIAESPDEVLYG